MGELGKRKRTHNKVEKIPQKQEPSLDKQIFILKKDVLKALRKSRMSKLKNSKRQCSLLDKELSKGKEGCSDYTKKEQEREKQNEIVTFLKELDAEQMLAIKLDPPTTSPSIKDHLIQLQARFFKNQTISDQIEKINQIREKKEEKAKKKERKALLQAMNQQSEENSDEEEITNSTPAAGKEKEILNSDDEYDIVPTGPPTSEGFTITMPSFGESFSDSDSDAVAMEIKDYFVDPALDDHSDDDEEDDEEGGANESEEEDEESSEGSDACDEPLRKKFRAGTKDKPNPLAPLPPKKQKKKNRMGQNARKRLLEIEKKREERASSYKNRNEKNGKETAKPAPNAKPYEVANTIETKPEELHPSWAAKKKVNIAAFAGKKVTFDESDSE